MHTHDITLGLAFGLGALHALEPGHGKTAMLLYLAGERRSLLHPLVMGLASAFSHSMSLIGIAAIVHLTHHMITCDHTHSDAGVVYAMKWISAGLVLAVGLLMFWFASRAKPTSCGCSNHQNHSNGSEAETIQGVNTSYSMSAMLGAAFGLMPCPSALAAYFSGLASGSPVQAYIVIGLFAAGIACSLTLVGMVVQVFGSRLMSTSSKISTLPWGYIRAGLISTIGLVYLGHVAFG